MAITPENQTGILAPNDLTEVSQPDTLAPNNLTEVAQTSVATPTTLPKVSQTALSAPNDLTEVAQPAIVAPTAIAALTQPVVNRPTPPLTLDLQFSKGNYQIGGTRGSLADLITFNRATTATYIDRTMNQWGGWEYSLKTAAIDEPRLSYDPASGESLGLLSESASANLFTYSEQLDNAAWSKTGVSISADAAAAIDGTMTFDKVTESSATEEHLISQTATLSGMVTVSAVVKSNGRDNIYIRGTNNGTFENVIFSISNVSVTENIGGLKANVDNFGGGIVRVSATFNADGALSSYVIGLIDSPTGSINYAGDGVSGAFMGDMQLEQKDYATSIIKTLASQATRAADQPTVNVHGGWYNQGEGCFYIESRKIGVSTTAVQAMFDISDGTTNNRLLYRSESGSDAVFNVQGGALISSTAVAVSSANNQKAAVNIFSASSTTAVDGVTYNTDGYNNGAYTVLGVGRDSFGSLQLDGHIKTLSYYPAKLSQSEQELITL